MLFENMTGASPLVVAMAVLYVLCLLVSVPAVLLRKKNLALAAQFLLVAVFILNSWVIAERWIAGGRPPFKTMYETFLFYPWCVSLVTIVLVYIHRLNILIPFSSGVCVIGLGYALYRPDVDIINLPPALQSAWFVPHVVTYFAAYAGLFASFVLAAISLAEHNWKSIKLSGSREATGETTREESRVAREAGSDVLGFELYAHQAAVFGIVALTLGLVMGAVWGKVAWGDYWAWDPKENWALVSWMAYMIYLHLRLFGKYRKRHSMWVLVVAFGAVVFTYLGMSMLPTASDSLHVYQ